jgi:hypothetical protein
MCGVLLIGYRTYFGQTAQQLQEIQTPSSSLTATLRLE